MPSVLVVDDDVAVRRTLARFLAREGFAVVEAGNGHEALTCLRTGAERATVILLDLRMPIMDGWTFRREQRLDPTLADIPVIVISGADGNGWLSWGPRTRLRNRSVCRPSFRSFDGSASPNMRADVPLSAEA